MKLALQILKSINEALSNKLDNRSTKDIAIIYFYQFFLDIWVCSRCTLYIINLNVELYVNFFKQILPISNKSVHDLLEWF